MLDSIDPLGSHQNLSGRTAGSGRFVVNPFRALVSEYGVHPLTIGGKLPTKLRTSRNRASRVLPRPLDAYALASRKSA